MYAILVRGVAGIVPRTFGTDAPMERYLELGQPFGHRASGVLAVCVLFFDSSVSNSFHTESTNH
jgi:hypothetical protein